MAVELVGTAPLPFKIPQSVLVVIHTPTLDVLLIRRAVDAPATVDATTVQCTTKRGFKTKKAVL